MERMLHIMESANMISKTGYGFLNEDAPVGDPMAGGADPMAAGGADPMAGGADPMAGGAAGADPMAGGAAGADPNAAGGAAPAGGAAGGVPPVQTGMAPAADPNAAADADPNATADPNADPNAETDPAADPAAMEDNTEAEDAGVDEEKIDELEKTQKELKEKMEGVDHRFQEMAETMSRIESLLNSHTEHLESFEKEFEKRNPTDTEKITMRQTKSAPFDETIEDNIEKMPDNYSPEDDNDGVGEPKYQITAREIDDTTDWANIAKSLDDRMHPTSLTDLLGI